MVNLPGVLGTAGHVRTRYGTRAFRIERGMPELARRVHEPTGDSVRNHRRRPHRGREGPESTEGGDRCGFGARRVATRKWSCRLGLVVEIDGCPLPEDRMYDMDNRVWARRSEADGTWTIGLLAPFMAFIGPVTRVTFRPLTPTIERGRSLGMVETVRFTGPVRTPVAGDWVSQNPDLVTHPRWLNDDPYGKGWFARVRPPPGAAPPPGLETAEAVRARVAQWIAHDRIRCWPQTPDVQMFEIGVECSAILTQLNDELARRPAGTVVMLVTDDPTSPIEMQRWSDQTGHAVLATRRDEALYTFLVRKEEHPVPRMPRRD